MATQFSVKDDVPWLKPFVLIYSGQVFSLLGSQLVQFALIWYLTVKTGSATVLAMASLVGMLPQVVLGPFVGTLVDRWNRRLTMIIADGVVAAATLLLAVLFALGHDVSVGEIYGLLFVRALAGAFHGNAMAASTSLMVPVEHLTRVQGINQMLNGGLNIVAAPLGALLLDALPMQGILSIDVTTALLAITPLLFIPVPQPDPVLTADGERRSFMQDFKQGLQYVFSWKGLLILSALAVLINFLLTPAFSLLPLLVKDHFGGGALQLGWIDAAFGIGVVLGGALLGVWGGFKRKMWTSMFGLAGLGLGVLILGIAPASFFNLALVGALLTGIMQTMTNGPIMAVMQSAVAPDMQARVFSLLSSAASVMSPLGLAVAGPLADHIGLQTWFILGGLLCLIFAVVGLFMPALMHLEDTPRQSVAAVS